MARRIFARVPMRMWSQNGYPDVHERDPIGKVKANMPFITDLWYSTDFFHVTKYFSGKGGLLIAQGCVRWRNLQPDYGLLRWWRFGTFFSARGCQILQAVGCHLQLTTCMRAARTSQRLKRDPRLLVLKEPRCGSRRCDLL